MSDIREDDGWSTSVRGLLCVREFSSCGTRTRKPLCTAFTLPHPRGTWNSSGRRVRLLGTDKGNIPTISVQSKRPLKIERTIDVVDIYHFYRCYVACSRVTRVGGGGGGHPPPSVQIWLRPRRCTEQRVTDR